MRYAEVNNLTNIIEREFNSENYVPIPHKFGVDKPTRIIPIVNAQTPEYNTETHYLNQGNKIVYEDRVEIGWNVILKPIPETVPLWAFRAILTVQGLAPTVENLILALPEPQKTVAYTQWHYGNFIDRSHPLINALGSQIGLTSEQIDNVFIEASKLK